MQEQENAADVLSEYFNGLLSLPQKSTCIHFYSAQCDFKGDQKSKIPSLNNKQCIPAKVMQQVTRYYEVLIHLK